jgi:hypothetical protein
MSRWPYQNGYTSGYRDGVILGGIMGFLAGGAIVAIGLLVF